MMNFDFDTLYLVNPIEISDEAYIRAVHADSILDNAKTFHSLEEALTDIDIAVATSAKETISEKKHLRNPIYLSDFPRHINSADGTVGLVFGREDIGLYNEEIAFCDLMVKIPASEHYETLNLSHSIGIFLYTLYLDLNQPPEKRTPIDNREKLHLYKAFKELLDEIDYPEHKYEKTQVMFKRMISRSLPSKWEYHTLMGVFRSASKKIIRLKKK